MNMRIARQVIGIGCRALLVLFVVVVLAFFINPPFFAESRDEFVELSGEKAKPRFRDFWPEGIASADVTKASGKYVSLMDYHAFWAQINLSPENAKRWQNQIHLKQQQTSQVYDRDKLIEGVDRTLVGPPPMHKQAGREPGWWKPPSIEFRSTEKMRWYKNQDYGYADGIYSGFDVSTRTLWIYEYSQQHDRFWIRGAVPIGDQFGSEIAKQQDGPSEPNLTNDDDESNRADQHRHAHPTTKPNR